MKIQIKAVPGNSAMQINVGILLMILTSTSTAALLSIADAPLFVTNSQKANVLVILDNSNSMDEAPNGSAVGSDSPGSKSEIARQAVRGLITTYTDKINMGLMAYQQTSMVRRHIHNAPYDASFDPANYDPTFTGARDSTTKRYRVPNASNPGSFIYYNIALPFYAGSSQGSRFCFSNTADFDNGGETFPGGPWDSYECYRNKTNELDDFTGFNTDRQVWTFSPTDSDLAKNILDFGTFITWDYVGETWFSNSSPGRGYLHTPIMDLDAAQAGLLNTKLAVSQFATNAPTNPSFSLQNAGLTPIEGTLLSAKDYFEGSLNAANEGGPQAAPPESCGKNFIALMTDGLPSTDRNGNVISNPVTAIADAAGAANALMSTSIGVTGGNVETYVIGFALNSPELDTIASAGGTSSAYMANDQASLEAAFNTIFSDILAKTGASSSAATNSTSLTSNSHIYQARFNSGDWSGQLLSTVIDTSGVLGAIVWDAADHLPAPAARKIITYSRDTKDGIPFQWADISALSDTTQQNILNSNALGVADGLGEERLNYLRGDASHEILSTPPGASEFFRRRATSKLGAIINSTPFFLGAPAAGYAENTMKGYGAFRAFNSTRTEIIFAGANDGMLHGFNAVTGAEEIAYVPGAIYDELSDLTDPTYGAGSSHRYFVDGSPMIADANLGDDAIPIWKTVLAGGFNAGGQGYYALDVTNASAFSEANAANLVLWEFTDEDDADMGYSFNQPTLNRLTNQSAQIARMADGRWALIIGNGYNNSEADGHASTTGHASLFILFLDGGTDGDWTDSGDYIKIDTKQGSVVTPNGLSTPRLLDSTGNGRVDAIYAGDLLGNMWKFDVSDASAANWGVAYGTTAVPVPLYTATDTAGLAQPITSAPIVTLAPGGNYLVGFATGRYLGLGDITNIDVQTIYAILDTGSAVAPVALRGNLQPQTVVSTQTVVVPGLGSVDTRQTSNNTVDYTTKKGWYVNLPDTGERVAFNPILRDGRFVFTTLIPDTGVCSAGGSGWLMELDYLTGAPLVIPPFIDVPGNPSGIKPPGGGIPNTPTVLGDPDNNKEFKIINQSTGNTNVISESVQYRTGRLSWREIIR